MAKRWLGRLRPVALLMMGGVALVLACPYLVSAYHIEAAGRAMDEAHSQTADLAPAHHHLQQAVKWDPSNAQAYRLLGKVYQAQGNWIGAIEALTRFRELRPDSPVGYLALAEYHTELEARLETSRLFDLLTSLPQADVYTPEVPIDTPYGPFDTPSWRGYVGRTTFDLPPGSDERPTLFMHSPSSATYALQLPEQPTVLHFGIGLAPRASDGTEDGATFSVLVDGNQVFSEHVDTSMSSQGWHERTVDLASWGGQEIGLTLTVAPGPLGHSTGDWAGWAEPQVVEPRWVELEPLASRAQMAEAWHKLGMTTEDLMHLGESARKADLPEEALVWYERATRLEPSLRDPWFYAGLAHEAQAQWQKAIEAYDYALGLRHSVEIGRSRLYAQKGNVYQRLLNPPQLANARVAYEAALAEGDFGSAREAAWVQARLGQVDYAQDGNAADAEARLLKALDLAPEDVWLHIVLGDFYREEGRVAEAVRIYERALERDPNSEAALTRLEALTK